MNKKTNIIIAFFLLILIFILAAIFIFSNKEKENQLIGGDRDENGCLTAAGYQFCPSTGKCQRMWEEYCEEYKDAYRGDENKENKITNFTECELAGNPIMETYPRQCRANGELFVENIDGQNFLENKEDLIILENPQPGANISSPLRVTGKARGNWFFEADFPVILTNWDGLIIAEAHATALDDWMTEDFVPFEAVLEFTPDTEVSNRGFLILQKDNPSGLPENDDALEITVFFE